MRRFDILIEAPKSLIFNEDSNKTVFGGSLSLIYLLITLGIAIFYFVNYFANDKSYYSRMRYTVTFITPRPQDSYIDEMKGALSYVKYDRHFTHDNLNHNVFTVYF